MDPRVYRAAASGDVQLLKGVAEKDLLSQSPQKNTALHIAAGLGHADFTEEILTRCRNTQLLRMKNSDDDTALHCAARAGCSQIVQLLMDFESKPMTAAHSSSSSSSSVRLLGMQNKEGDTALHEALSNQHEEMAIDMVKADPKLAFLVNNAKKSPFHVAANEEMVQVVKEVLVGTHRSPNSNTFELTEEDKRKLVRMQDNNGRTGLHYAAWRNNAEIVGMILGSDISRDVAYIADENGHTALHVAAAFGMQNSMAVLLEHCPDAIDQLDRDGRNVLHIAVLNRRYESIRWLKKKQLPEFGGLLNGQDKDGNTPLHLSVEDWVSSLFWDRRAKLQKSNKDGRTALGLQRAFYWWLPEGFRCSGAWGLRRHMPHVIPIEKPSPGTVGAGAESNSITSADHDKPPASSNDYVLVASLIATVTFAAAFTLPGGYRSGDDKANPGKAVLATEPAFKAFLLFDALAMCSSIFAIFCFTVAGRVIKTQSSAYMASGNCLTLIACSCMLFALAAGVFVAIPPESMRLAKALLVICSFLSSLFIFPFASTPYVLLLVWHASRPAHKACAAHTNPTEAHRVAAV